MSREMMAPMVLEEYLEATVVLALKAHCSLEIGERWFGPEFPLVREIANSVLVREFEGQYINAIEGHHC
ncbi:hypothetical protein Tco_0786496 [Tanacetum coccineum]